MGLAGSGKCFGCHRRACSVHVFQIEHGLNTAWLVFERGLARAPRRKPFKHITQLTDQSVREVCRWQPIAWLHTSSHLFTLPSTRWLVAFLSNIVEIYVVAPHLNARRLLLVLPHQLLQVQMFCWLPPAVCVTCSGGLVYFYKYFGVFFIIAVLDFWQ